MNLMPAKHTSYRLPKMAFLALMHVSETKLTACATPNAPSAGLGEPRLARPDCLHAASRKLPFSRVQCAPVQSRCVSCTQSRCVSCTVQAVTQARALAVLCVDVHDTRRDCTGACPRCALRAQAQRCRSGTPLLMCIENWPSGPIYDCA